MVHSFGVFDVPDRKRTRVSRYEIRDRFLRFHFQFIIQVS